MKRNTFFGILLVVFMFLGSCEREPMDSSESIENILANDIMEIKAGWEAFTFNAPLAGLPMNEMVVDWENPVQRDSVTGTAYEFPITQEFPAILNSDDFEAESLALVVYDGEKRLYRVVRMLHTTDSSEASTFLEPSGLDGTVHVYDLEGKNILVMAYEKGELVASALDEDLEDVPEVGLSKTARCSTRKSASWASLKRSYNSNCNGGGGYNRVRVEHYTDWFNHRGNGQWEFQRSEHTGTTYEYVYSPGAGYGGATIYRETARPYGGSGAAFNSWWRQNSVFFNTTPEGYEKKYKIFNNLTGKADCVYKKLKIHSGNFRKAIRKFDGDFPVTHLQFIQEDLGTERGETRAPNGNGSSPDFVVTVILNDNSSVHGIEYRPNLLIAKTIAHEIIHAEMYRKLLSLAKQGNLDFTNWSSQQQTNYISSLKNNFPGLFDYYTRYNWNTSTPNNSQHQTMATHYRGVLARILQEFDSGIPVSSGQPIKQIYMDLAWEGLRYPSIHTWNSLSSTEKKRIDDTIENYIKAKKNEKCSK